jgi:hypothetical protein
MTRVTNRSEVMEMQEPVRKGVTRLVAGYTAIAFILPYLALKTAWVSGAPVGMTNKSMVAQPGMLALNMLTLCMDAIALLLALTFTHSWGLRAPVWPALFPMWVATGFLAPIAVVVPMTVLARIFGSGPGPQSSSAPSPIEPWAAAVVYTSFVGQGLALMAAFLLYVRARWDGLLRTRIADGQPPHSAIALLGKAAAVVATAVGLLHLLWAAGAPLGLSSRLLQERGLSFHLLHAAFGLAGLGAAAGIVMLVSRIGRRPLWLPLSLAWTGSSAMFSWGAWLLLPTLGLAFSPGPDSWLLPANNVVKTTAGLLIGVLMGLLVAARARGDFSKVA